MKLKIRTFRGRTAVVTVLTSVSTAEDYAKLRFTIAALASNEYRELLVDVHLLTRSEQQLVHEIVETYAATIRIHIQLEPDEWEFRQAS